MGRKMCSIRTSYMHALICMHFICMLSCVQFFEILWSVAHQTPMFMGFSDKNIGVGCRFLLWGIFLTQGSNSRLLHVLYWQVYFLQLTTWETHSVQFSYSVVSNVLQPHALQHARPPWPHQLSEFTQTHVH